jgi:protein-L-isoaspartate(D-aspartate) O-methyltransferase
MHITDIRTARFNMIEQQIRPWNVLDSSILDALSVVRREDFVPEEHRALAFADMELPIGQGQYMLAPRVEARMLQDLHLEPTDSVLEIGTGSGYMAALLGHRAHRVVSLEIDPTLADAAHHRLREAGVRNVEVRIADGAAHTNGATGNIEGGPFDVIVLSGSVAQIPAALLQQLRVGGRLAAIVGDLPVMRATFVRRNSGSDFSTTQPWDTVAPRLHGFAELPRFHF